MREGGLTYELYLSLSCGSKHSDLRLAKASPAKVYHVRQWVWSKHEKGAPNVLGKLLTVSLGAALLMGTFAVAAYALPGGCDANNVCGYQQDPASTGGGNAWSDAYITPNGATRNIEVQENHETDHWYGWTTDNTAQNGPATVNYQLQANLQVGCPGSSTQEFNANLYDGGHQFDSPAQGAHFHC